ncbi:hypothetical protein Csa_010797 [Cucumis sativus]|uniref:Uncharacterized protein n=1 Tax=Cucumis sativus TaxID=3659 RepID=A0A0A0L6W6_CUCSA|nr:hypothetical protein Csa_010797 [Cucumis sativus]
MDKNEIKEDRVLGRRGGWLLTVKGIRFVERDEIKGAGERWFVWGIIAREREGGFGEQPKSRVS